MKTKLNDLFDQIEPEKGNDLDDKIQLVEDEITKELIEKLHKSEKDAKLIYNWFSEKEYLTKILPKKYTAKQITKFSNALTDEIIKKNGTDATGTYLNHLIQESPDQNHTIYTKHLEQKLTHIGWQNTKNIKIIGDLGDHICEDCKSGNIIINGNVGRLGFLMTNGTITVNGKIHLLSVAVCGGNIYQYDKQIVKNGEIIDSNYL